LELEEVTRNLYDKAPLTNYSIFLPHQQEQYTILIANQIHGIDVDHGPRNSPSGNTTMQKQGRLYQDASEVEAMMAK